MAKRTISVGLQPEQYGSPVWESAPDDNDSCSGLLWADINYICRKAKLNINETEIISLYFRGFSTRDIAMIYKVSHVTIYNREQEILEKMSKVKWRGLITVVVEAHGWEGLRWVINGPKSTKNDGI